jgi:cholesterol transport system auxiliary component
MSNPIDIASARSNQRVFAVIAAALVLAGCGGGLLGPSEPPPQIYVLQPQFRALDDSPPVAWQLSIAQPDTAQTLQTARISLQRGQTMDYFADAQWTDSTPHLLQSLLVQAFETSGRIRGVAPESAGARADYVLETETRSFQAQYPTDNGVPSVVVTIVARLVTAGHGDVIGTFEASHEAQAAQNTVPAVVQAFDAATSQSLEDVVAWTLKAPSRRVASSGTAHD